MTILSDASGLMPSVWAYSYGPMGVGRLNQRSALLPIGLSNFSFFGMPVMCRQISVVSAALCVFLCSCVYEDSRAGGGSSGAFSRRIAITVEADYLDVYGAIQFEVEGHGASVLDRDSHFSCQEPALILDLEGSQEILIKGYSANHFTWVERVLTSQAGDCVKVAFRSDGVRSGLLYFTRTGPAECFPVDIYVKIGADEWLLGTLVEPWIPNYKDLPTPEARARNHLEAANAGRSALLGGGSGWRGYSYREVGPCKNEEYDLQATPPELGYFGNELELESISMGGFSP